MAGRETSEKQIFGITVAIVAVVLIVVTVFTFLSYRELSELKATTEFKFKQVKEHEDVIRKGPQVENDLREAKARFANVEKYLPSEKDVDGLLEAFGNKCIDSKLEFSRLERTGATTAAARKTTDRKDVENIQFKGEFSGTFHSLARFVSMLEDWQHFERFVNITQFRMEAQEDGLTYDTGAQKHNISMTLELYKYEEPKATTPGTTGKPARPVKGKAPAAGTAPKR